MRVYKIAFALAVVCLATIRSTIATATEAIVNFGYRIADLALSIVPESSYRLAVAGDQTMRLSIGGVALDPALRQSMRHESRVSKRAADRHT